MSNNYQVVKLADGREVCLSYGVIVAAFIPSDYQSSHYAIDGSAKRGYLRTKERYSTTTSKHMNAFAGKDSPQVDDAILRALVAPVTDRK